jgi:hypothetical protein
LTSRFDSLSVMQSADPPAPGSKISDNTPKTSNVTNGTVTCVNGTNCTADLLVPQNNEI